MVLITNWHQTIMVHHYTTVAIGFGDGTIFVGDGHNHGMMLVLESVVAMLIIVLSGFMIVIRTLP